MNALEAINRAIHWCFENNFAVYGITMHEEWTTRNYVFVVETYEKHYIICNKRDFLVACAALRMGDVQEDLDNYIYGINIDESEEFFQTATSGRYVCTLVLEQDSQKNQRRLSFPNS